MIEFNGEVSDTIRKKVIKKRDKFIGYIFTSIALIGYLILLLFVLFMGWDNFFIELLIFISLIFILGCLIIFITPPKNLFRFKWHYSIKIEGEIITLNNNLLQNNTKTIALKKVKKVVDENEFYSIIYQDYSNCLICQKSLLTKGTIEEFEKLFEGKIIRKKQK